MSQQEMISLVHNYLDLESEIKQQQLVLEDLRNQIKEEMEARNVEELPVGEHIVRYRDVTTSVFDRVAFRKDHEFLYKTFLKQIQSKKFTIS